MIPSTPLVLATLLPLSLAAVPVEREIQKRVTCYDVYLFLASGFQEPLPGRVDAILSDVCNGLPSCSGEDIKWDITQSYCGQLDEGVTNGKSQINAYVQQCPNSQIVPVGYSLGAQVVGDILGGVNSDTFYGCQEKASAALGDAGNQIAAAVLLGNPRHVASQAYNYGDGSAKNGQYPRAGTELAGLNAYSCLLQDICELDDPICALGNNGTDHEQYITHYGVEATAFIRGKLSEGSGSCRSQVSSSVALSSTTVSSSTHVASSAPTSGSSASDFSAVVSTSSSSYDSAITASSTPVTTYVPIPLSNTGTGTTSTFSPSTFSASTTDWSTNLPTAVLSVFTAATVAVSNATIVKPTLSSTASISPAVSGISTGGGYQNSASLALGLMTMLALRIMTL